MSRAGSSGGQGAAGHPGPKGEQGSPGPSGVTGPPGLTGATGPQGDKGPSGSAVNRLPPKANTITLLDTDGTVGWYPSVTIGSDGLGLISYYDATNQRLKVAHCTNEACSSATKYTVDDSSNVGWFTSIAMSLPYKKTEQKKTKKSFVFTLFLIHSQYYCFNITKIIFLKFRTL